jgi:hypothetical protein
MPICQPGYTLIVDAACCFADSLGPRLRMQPMIYGVIYDVAL